MTRLALSLAVIGLAAACADEPVSPPVRANVTSQPPVVVAQPSQPVVVTPPASPAPTITTAPAAPATIIVQPAGPRFRAGGGTVESTALVSPPSAAAGGTGRGIYRLTLRMDDGTVQMLDIDSRSFMVGDRVTVTSGGQVTRP